MQNSRAPVVCNNFPAVSSALLKKFPAVYILQSHLPWHKSMHATGQVKLVHIMITCLVTLHFNIVTNLNPRVSKAMTKNVNIFGLNMFGS